jgi:hypothetical protein
MKTILFLLFNLISILGYCDHIDFFTIKVNDSIIYDSRVNIRKVHTLKLSTLKLSKKDTITIHYRTDTPCPVCQYCLFFTNSEKEKIGLFRKTGNGEFKFCRKEFKKLTKFKTEIYYFREQQDIMKKILVIE